MTTVDIYGGKDPWEVPAYTLPVAARHVRVPAATLRYWVVGRDYELNGVPKHAKPLIAVPRTRLRFLSFLNLIEAHVLASMRRRYELPMPRVRTAIKYLEEQLGSKHPLATEDFRTDGADIFVERMGEFINVSSTKAEMRTALEAGLERIEYEDGMARKLFPFVREDGGPQPKFVVLDPRIAFGRPVVVGTGIPVEEIAGRFQAGDSRETLSYEFAMKQEMVEEAIRAARAAA